MDIHQVALLLPGAIAFTLGWSSNLAHGCAPFPDDEMLAPPSMKELLRCGNAINQPE